MFVFLLTAAMGSCSGKWWFEDVGSGPENLQSVGGGGGGDGAPPIFEPELDILSLSATPSTVSPGSTVTVSAQVTGSGITYYWSTTDGSLSKIAASLKKASQAGPIDIGLKIGVTPAGYDDIAQVIGPNRLNWAYDEIAEEILADPVALAIYDVVFINCPSNGKETTLAPQAKTVLQNWVNNGGVLYISDWASAYIEEAWPTDITYVTKYTYNRIADAGQVTADVEDASLATFLGQNTMPIEFDLSAWVPMKEVPTSTRVYLSADLGPLVPDTIYDEQGNPIDYTNWGAGAPIMVGFEKGKGRVIYTSFHNEGQPVSTLEDRLIEYMVLLAATVPLQAEVDVIIQQAGGTKLNEFPGAIDLTQTSEPVQFQVDSFFDVFVYCNWSGSELKLDVYRPDGSLYGSASDATPPNYVQISKDDYVSGNWTFKVTGVDVPGDNYPYIVSTAKVPSQAGPPPVLNLTTTENSIRWAAPNTPGAYTITLNVTDTQGASDSDSVNVTVQ